VSEGIIEVRHNIEVAHRLSLLEGKCENIHGHSMWVELQLEATYKNDNGIFCNAYGTPMEFGEVKRAFRTYLDYEYDHHLLLNQDDEWAQGLVQVQEVPVLSTNRNAERLPGLKIFPGDPSTENIASWVAQWAADIFRCNTTVKVQETSVNAAIMKAYHAIG
jgi:6-pyruvoyltetrahydropterin/6-carboxytetrahydropterin synthase